ncbi:ABC transporter permease [Pseudonocardia sp.]|jgi:ABC-type dipeptide/oligopeptide/nickel transport system permease component|uniref:ABC transporter permease n=1 Tax=Pseudonocardia sp. TaxID=60912 RepID=UPI0031FD5317
MHTSPDRPVRARELNEGRQGHLLSFLRRRALQWVPVLLVSSLVVFSIVHLLPGDPAVSLAGPDASTAVIEGLRHNLGLDRPLPLQYVSWLGRALRGDFGDSYTYHSSAAGLIFGRLPASLELAVVAVIFAVLFAVPVGVISAVWESGFVDRCLSSLTSLMISTPNFWFGILAILLFSVKLGWLPAGGSVDFTADPAVAVQYIVLPGAALAVEGAATLARFTRGALLDVLNDDYIRTARAKGASALGVVGKHALGSALVPIVTMAGIVFGRTIGGAVIIETVFAWPGIGRLLVQSIGNRDYPVVQGVLLVLVLLFLVINLAVDLLYSTLDPRIRLEGRRA